MAVTAFLYGQMLEAAFGKKMDWTNDDIYCALATSTYTPDQDTHDFWDDVTNEISGTGYTANGVVLGSKTAATSGYTGGTNIFSLDAADATWTTSTLTARYAVVYDRTPATDASRPLLLYQNAGADVSTTAGTFTVAWHGDGLIHVTVS